MTWVGVALYWGSTPGSGQGHVKFISRAKQINLKKKRLLQFPCIFWLLVVILFLTFRWHSNVKNNQSNKFSEFKLVGNEVSHKILGLLCQKFKIQDGQRKPFWTYANKHIKEKKVCHVIAVWSCDARHGIPGNSPHSTLRQTQMKLRAYSCQGGLLVNTWQMTT